MSRSLKGRYTGWTDLRNGHVLFLYATPVNSPRSGTVSHRMGASWGGRQGRSICLMGTEFPFGKMKKFWRWMKVMVVQCECCELIIHLTVKIVNFMLCVFYHTHKLNNNIKFSRSLERLDRIYCLSSACA